MSGFKRFCMVIFFIAGAITLAALALPWYGPWVRTATALFAIGWYYIAIEVCLGITAVGLIVTLIFAIAAPKNDSIVITNLDGGQVTISRDAIASQARHIVESDGTCTAKSVRIKARRKGRIRVHVKVVPYSSIDVTAKAPELHDDLMTGLAALCSDRLRSVDLEFLKPEMASDLPVDDDDYLGTSSDYTPASSGVDTLDPSASTSTSEPASAPAQESVPDGTGDITVPMHDERSE